MKVHESIHGNKLVNKRKNFFFSHLYTKGLILPKLIILIGLCIYKKDTFSLRSTKCLFVVLKTNLCSFVTKENYYVYSQIKVLKNSLDICFAGI